MRVSYEPMWRLLQDKGLTIPELRRMTGIAASTFTKIRRNECVSLDVLARLAKALECGIDDLLVILDA